MLSTSTVSLSLKPRRIFAAIVLVLALASATLAVGCDGGNTTSESIRTETESTTAAAPTPTRTPTRTPTQPSSSPTPRPSPTPFVGVPTSCHLESNEESAGSTDDVDQLRVCSRGQPPDNSDVANMNHYISRNPNSPPELLERLAGTPNQYVSVLCGVASNPSTPVELIRQLATEYLHCLATNPSAPIEFLCELAARGISDRAGLDAASTIAALHGGRWQESCGVPTPTPDTSFGDGIRRVGSGIAPGTYIAAGGESCYWARLSGFTGELSDIIANHFGPGQQIVSILPSDAGFEARGCGRWTLTN